LYNVNYTPVGFWITSDLGNDLDARGLVGSVSHGPSHLLMSERLGGVRPEGELGAEHSLEIKRTVQFPGIQMLTKYIFFMISLKQKRSAVFM
jgi:hypothetical protein